jgi:hypothetical protein
MRPKPISLSKSSKWVYIAFPKATLDWAAPVPRHLRTARGQCVGRPVACGGSLAVYSADLLGITTFHF